MKKICFFMTLAFFIAVSTAAFALNAQGLRYYFAGGRALSFVESKPKPKDTATFGFGINYTYHPLEIGNAGGARVSGVVDHLLTFDLMGSYSFSDQIAVGLNIPLHYTRNLATLGNAAMESNFNIGDIMITGLYNFIDPGENTLNAGLSIAPFLTLPSGKSSDYVGESNMTGGMLMIGDFGISGHYVGVNLGFRFRKTENFLGLSVASEFMYQLAYHHTISEAVKLDGFAEFSGATVMKDFWQKANSSPFEVRGGVTKAFMPNDVLKVTAAIGSGFGGGFSTPEIRTVLKITYDHPINRPVVNRIEQIEKELKELTIYYPTDGAQVDPYYDVKIAGIAKILRDNPDLGPLYIVGATDDVGSKKYNQKLSEKRAKQAFHSIVDRGLDPAMIVYAGFGEDYPVVENSSDANRALNRRTLFTFIKPEQLQEKQTKRGTVGYNVLTGKKSDSYTEVLKELDRRKTQTEPGSGAVVIKKYKDASTVIVDETGETKVKDRPGAEPKEVNIKPKSKKYYEKKNTKTEGGTIIIREREPFFKDDGGVEEEGFEEVLY